LIGGIVGTGKSRTAEAIAHELDLKLYRISAENVIDKWVGSTAQNIEKAFRYAKHNRDRVIFFIDEIEGLVGKRDFSTGGSREVARAVNTFLTLMEETEDLIILGATNHVHELDQAVISRFTKIIWYDLPTKEMLYEIIKIHFKDLPLSEDVDLQKVANDCFELNYSGRDIRNLTVEIAQEMLTFDKDILTNEILDLCLNRLRERDYRERSLEYAKVLNGEQKAIKLQHEHVIKHENSETPKTEIPEEEAPKSEIPNPLTLFTESNNIPIDNPIPNSNSNPKNTEIEKDDLVSFTHFTVKRIGFVKSVKRKNYEIIFFNSRDIAKTTLQKKETVKIKKKFQNLTEEEMFHLQKLENELGIQKEKKE
jgi:SpoVK/Ycf46/Vps4 family AAA+-type ATPase